jgi:hypothetical protein
VTKFKMIFLQQSVSLGRVIDGGGVDSIFQFRLERGCDGTKHCRKMKRSQRACLHSIGRKRDMVQRRGDVDSRRGSPGEGKEMRRRQLD